MYICASLACLVPEEGHIIWSWSYKRLWVTIWALGIEPRSSRKAASALHRLAISPAPSPEGCCIRRDWVVVCELRLVLMDYESRQNDRWLCATWELSLLSGVGPPLSSWVVTYTDVSPCSSHGCKCLKLCTVPTTSNPPHSPHLPRFEFYKLHFLGLSELDNACLISWPLKQLISEPQNECLPGQQCGGMWFKVFRSKFRRNLTCTGKHYI